MNMSARVVKKYDAEAFMPFQIPEIGQTNAEEQNQSHFIFPEIGSSKAAVNTSIEEDWNDPSLHSDPEILQTAHDKAQEIIARAENDAQMIEEAAREKALLEARTTIEAEISERVNEEVSGIREKLAATIDEISSLQAAITEKAEKDLVELALQIAKKITRRELTLDREITLTLVKISLAKLHNRVFAEVHLHPEDFEYLQSHREKLDFHGSLELKEDRSLTPGDCLIRTETGDIDARIESQFDEIAYGLLGR